MNHALRCSGLFLSLAAVACSDRTSPEPDVGREEEVASEAGPQGRWQWVAFQGMDDSSLEITDPSRYTLEIGSDGVSVRADCNRGTGGYALDGSSLTFTPFAVTSMACPGESLADTYLGHLGYVRSWIVEDGDLYLSLFADGGIMRFRPAGGSP